MDASKSLSWFYNDFTLFQQYQFLFLMYTNKDSNLISCTFLFFDCFLSLVLQLRLIWHCESWKLEISPHQIPVLPSLHLYCFGIHYELFILLSSLGLSALASAYLPESFTFSHDEHLLPYLQFVSFSSILFCSVWCIVLLFMPSYSIKLLSIFCGFDEHFFFSQHFHSSDPG